MTRPMIMNKLSDGKAWNFSENHKWFDVDKDKEIPEILIYDVIGDSWDGITAKQFMQELAEIESDEIVIRINSPGGLVYEGLAIYNAIKAWNGKVTTKVDGVAASMASVIFMAGDERQMPANADLMMHKPWSFTIGNAAEMREDADELDRLQSKIEAIYAANSNLSDEEIHAIVEPTTWMDGIDANEKGFATEILEDAKIAACVFDLSSLPGVPDRHVKVKQAAEKRERERALRDAGMTRTQAKAEVSGSTAHRDDGVSAAKDEFLKLLNQIGG